ncbi:MAG: carboxypeptidase regulatory-like domain-containing protein [Acidobacteria bacterium]|nr:carboxypeptidase regulatory-like domain-containing protein [Acidobacteriota bacterium]
MRFQIVCFAVVLMFSAIPASAQDGAVSGTVQDATGAVLPGVSVKLTSKAQGTVRQQVTNEAGVYQFTFLPPGIYDLEVSLPGFKTLTRTDFTLAVAQKARLDFQLEVGDVTDTVTVSANSETVNTMSAELGAVVDNTRVVEMPLNGRTFYSLATLVPGVTPPRQGSSNSHRGGFNVAGASETANNFSLNGMENNDSATMAPLLRPSIDAIQEFTILTGVYPAQYGYGDGGQIIVTTKSGTNTFHGTVFNFIRNSAVLTARNFFQAPGPLPSFKRNQFGATFGGPIKKDKTFFFYSYEGFRDGSSVNVLGTVPTAAMKRGDFSVLLPSRVIRDPATGQPFPGNIIPPNRLSPIGRALLDFYPDPTFETPAGSLPRNNYAFSATRFENMNQHILKVDHTFNSRDSGFVTANYYKADATERVSVPSCGANPLPKFGCDGIVETGIFGITEVHVFSPSMVNEFRAGYMLEANPSFKHTLYTPFWATFGIKPLTTSLEESYPHQGPPSTTIAGYTGFTNSLFDRDDDHWQLTDNLSVTRSKHTMKTGFNMSSHGVNLWPPTTVAGSVNFQNTSQGPTTTYGLADVLLGYPTTTSLRPNPIKYSVRVWNFSAYFQDDFQVNSRLTLNLGLRWELNAPATARPRIQTTFDPQRGIPVQEGTNGYGNRVFDFDKKLFGPRVGFAWQPTGGGRTVVRAGVGTFFSNFPIWNTISGIYAGYPVTINNTYTSSLTQPILLSDPFPASNAVTSNTLTGVDRKQRYPRSYQWSLGVQRQLTNDMLFEITYLGKAGNHLRVTDEINQPAPGPGTPAQVNARRPYRGYGSISFYGWSGSSRYHSMQARLQQQYRNGLSFLASYTYSHSIDNTGSPTNAYDRRTARGPSNFDIRHRLALSPVYELPFGMGKPLFTTGMASKIFGGWQISPLFQWQTGVPLTPVLSGNFSNTGGTTDRPDVTSDPNKDAPRTPEKWFNTAAFLLRPASGAAGATYSFGNAGVGIITSPGMTNLDVSIVRTFQARERVKVQFRAEIFNALNHTNFGYPNVTANDPQFGTISTALPPRQSQFALKITF